MVESVPPEVRMLRRVAVSSALLALCAPALAQEPAPAGLPRPAPAPAWTQLSRATCGVDRFEGAHPERDGRGVVIAVLDTGVDMGIPGLQRTATGEPKVIDVQDFSGQGDVDLAPVRWDSAAGRLVRTAGDGLPESWGPPPAVALPAPLEACTLWLGVFAEASLLNSRVEDPNQNGRTDDAFAILVAVPPGGGDDDAVAFVDTDCDRDLGDERPLRTYRLRRDTFTFARLEPARQVPVLTCALNLEPSARRVSVHFDDGGHGTHVAGIAAGCGMLGQPDFHGVAPGAQVLSLKIGDNRRSGGATTTASMRRAFEYAAAWARDHGVPVVVNLSYGVDSEREGLAGIDRFLDELCQANPGLVCCVAAGNSGPGLSTVGTPAAAGRALTIAALLAPDTARDVRGEALERPAVALFSSRGGELAKPDLATPGFSTSTVPRWEQSGDFWSGTSMATPYAAGLCALLLSGAGPDVPAAWVKDALQRSARPIPGTTALDCGAGVPELVRAAELLAARRAAGPDPLLEVAVRTESPLAPGGEGPAAYWRSAWVPVDRPQLFTLEPRFLPGPDALARTDFARRFQLESDAPWLRPAQQQVYLRGAQAVTVRVDYDAEQLREPGLHVGTIRGTGPHAGFRLVNAVVVPHRVGPESDYRLRLTGQQVAGWAVRRVFVAAPPGASALQVTLSSPPGARSSARVRQLCRPDGTAVPAWELNLDTREGRDRVEWALAGPIEPGVWELVLASGAADEASSYDLEVAFVGLACQPARVTTWEHPGPAPPAGSLSVTNLFERPLACRGEGALEGTRVRTTATLRPDADALVLPLLFTPELRAARVRVAFSREGFARMTDVAVNVLDPEGRAIARAALGGREVVLEAHNPDPSAAAVACTLRVDAAFAGAAPGEAAEVEVELDALWREPIAIELGREGAGPLTLYPGIACPLRWTLARTPPLAPSGARHVGWLRLHERGHGKVVLEVPIER